MFGLAGVVVLLVALVGWLLMRPSGGDGIPAGSGELVVESRPPGARVIVDNEEKGVTPLKVALPAGPHILQVRVGSNEPRVIPLVIRANVQTSQYVELQNVPTTGAVDVRSTPSRARVIIDGQNRGITPVIVKDLPPGEHELVVELNGRQAKQTIRIDAGGTIQVMVPIK